MSDREILLMAYGAIAAVGDVKLEFISELLEDHLFKEERKESP